MLELTQLVNDTDIFEIGCGSGTAAVSFSVCRVWFFNALLELNPNFYGSAKVRKPLKIAVPLVISQVAQSASTVSGSVCEIGQ